MPKVSILLIFNLAGSPKNNPSSSGRDAAYQFPLRDAYDLYKGNNLFGCQVQLLYHNTLMYAATQQWGPMYRG